MAGSSAAIPIIVAVIGVLGALIPAIYVNSLQTQPEPDVTLSVSGMPWNNSNYFDRITQRSETPFYVYAIDIRNELGNAPATNMSIIVKPKEIHDLGDFWWSGILHAGEFGPNLIVNVTNVFSTADIILPQYDNTILEPESTKTINDGRAMLINTANMTIDDSPLEIRIQELMNGIGSKIILHIVTLGRDGLEVYGVYDQGSNQVSINRFQQEDALDNNLNGISYVTSNQPRNFTTMVEDYVQQSRVIMSTLFSPGLMQFYVIFFATLSIVVYLYIRRRKMLKRFLSKIVKNIVEIRGALRDDHTNKDIFSEVWFEIPEKKRQDNHDIGDYLIIDDFYSKLKRRNLYLSRDIDNEESDLSRANTLSRLNEALLAAAENVLNKVDWNKYRG